MFSQKDFIDASRKFVCVRLESYESKEHQDLVRKFLNGSFANTAFCLLAPDGKTRLSGAGRGPEQALGRRRQGGNGDVVSQMTAIADDYKPNGKVSETTLQDFHSFRQALNVASGDQRLLVYAVASEANEDALREKLAPIFASEDIVGLFHLDFADKATDKSWPKAVRESSDADGLYIIRADSFGQSGEALEQLPLSSDTETIRGALLAANLAFSVVEARKDYSSHVSEGRREGIHFENAMPYGEDRDGDGEIDHRGGDRRDGKNKGKGKGAKGAKR